MMVRTPGFLACISSADVAQGKGAAAGAGTGVARQKKEKARDGALTWDVASPLEIPEVVACHRDVLPTQQLLYKTCSRGIAVSRNAD